jgi:hypothetical protein
MAELATILKSGDIKSLILGVLAQNYAKGQLSYDEDSLTILADTGIAGVRVNIGQEQMYLVWNDHAVNPILNGKACYASGVDATNTVLKVDLADNSSFITSAQLLGLATHEIAPKSLGLVTKEGVVRDFNTTALTPGLTYLGTSGNMTATKPLYPASRFVMGVKLKDGVNDGAFQISFNNLVRKNASRSYSFTSQGIVSGTYWKAGFYDYPTTSHIGTQAAQTISHGISGRAYAAHASIIVEAIGSVVGGGVVGLRVSGIKDSELGSGQIAAQTETITEDITTLVANTYYETNAKWSGDVLYELYVVSGTPTSYSLNFNYGYAKYEDASDIDFTITAFEAVWQANATNNTLDIALMKHTPEGWTYAATGFGPGNGDICRKSIDMALAGNTTDNTSGAYKRTNLNQFIDGNGNEGIVIQVTTSGNNTVQTMDMHIVAVNEELD